MTSQGTPFGRYRLTERLAVGGMAELYRAVLRGPSGFSKTVAIKKITPQLCRHSRFRKMFLHEGRIMSALGHRNVVQVFELGEVDGELFMCLELVDGCDLARILRRQNQLAPGTEWSLDPLLSVWIARELCLGLDYVHTLTDDQGRPLHVIHRDVNPHNILLSRHGDVKLGDFGIAKSLVGEVQTVQGQVRGKLEYMSPEQARGDALAPTSDVYAVGLVLYEMLSGERYIQGDGQLELMRTATRPAWRPLAERFSRIPDALDDLVHRALRLNQEQRFASAMAMAEALGAFLDAQPHSPGSPEVARLVQATLDQATEATRQPPPLDPPPNEADDLLPQGVLLPDRDSILAHHTVSLAPEEAAPRTRRRRFVLPALLVLAAVAASVFLWLAFDPEAGQAEPNAQDPEPPARDQITGPPPMDPEPDEDPADTQAAAGHEPAAEPPDEAGHATLSGPRNGKKSHRKRRRRTRKHRNRNTKPARPPREQQTASAAALPSIADLRTELGRQKKRIRTKGIRKGDIAAVDKLLLRVQRAVGKGDRETASGRLRELDVTLDGLEIDRGFIERKIRRLQRRLARDGLESRFSRQNREILNHAVHNRFQQANTALNAVFDRLEKRGK